jgi:hypothetical protein
MHRAGSNCASNAQKPIAESLGRWLTRQRGQVPDGSATRKVLDYSLGRWAALIRSGRC